MLSQKIQDDLMSAYQKVYEEKRGHAAGASDTEKQASQLASDVRYKAKSKVPADATEEEKRKIFLQILAASPAPNVVKAMAKDKLLGEEVIHEMRFDDGKEGKEKRKESLRKKRGMTKAQMDKHPQFKDDDVKEGKMPEGLKKYLEKKQGKKEVKEALGSNFFKKLKLKKGSQMQQKLDPTAKQKQANLDQENLNRKFDKSHYEPQGNPLQEEEKAPRMQKGAMAYDGPNKERSEAADRVLAKAKKKREEKMKEEFVNEKMMAKKLIRKPVDPVNVATKAAGIAGAAGVGMAYKKTNESAGKTIGEMKIKSKPKNLKDMSKGVEQKAPVDYRTLAQSHVPVGNIFNEKMDPVGKEDKDIDNDGDHDSTDKYLLKRRKAIGKAIAKKRGKVKEGFSAWRIDLDFNEQVKK